MTTTKQMSAKDEWLKFNDLYKKSPSQALKYAKNMQDPENKKAALRFLSPSKAQKARAKSVKYDLNDHDKAHLEKMHNHPGFMPKLNDPYSALA
jgi:hypothetical protein